MHTGKKEGVVCENCGGEYPNHKRGCNPKNDLCWILKEKEKEEPMDALVCKACALEGCNKEMHCFGGSVNGLCVEAIARYNELRKKELTGASK